MLQARPQNSPALRVVRQPEEQQFVARCVAGDSAALRQLWDRERVRVHGLLFRVVGANTHMDDLLQDAFLEVYRSLPGFRGESSLRTWIDRCVVRVAYGYFRRKERLPALEGLQDPHSASPSAEERASLREAARRLYQELDRLETKQRIAFTLHAIEDRPLREVAEIMESTEVTAKLRVWRARQALEKRARKDPLLAEFLGHEKDRRKEVSA
jgi:RNA polymerase sigma-70 factor, ECF subfamily